MELKYCSIMMIIIRRIFMPNIAETKR